MTVGNNLKMNRIYIICVFCSLIISSVANSQNNIDKLILTIKETNSYPNLDNACEELLKNGKDAIPQLIELLNDSSYIKLTNTADLIYPGAKEFYGHGNIISYNINFVSIRAGWILEKITFKEFGYRNNDCLSIEDSTVIESINKNRIELATKVENWWIENEKEWSLLSALQNALKSNNFWEQYRALDYLENIKKNESLKHQDFESKIKPLLKKLMKSKDLTISEKSEWILINWNLN